MVLFITYYQALWQWLLATASVDPWSVASLLERMDSEDASSTAQQQLETGGFSWAIRGSYWRKDKKPGTPTSLPRDTIQAGGSGTSTAHVDFSEAAPLSSGVRWIILENLWAIEIPASEPERGWWTAERESRLATEMDRDRDHSRMQNGSLRCNSANTEDTSMQECWGRYMAISQITYKEIFPSMDAFNRRRIPVDMYYDYHHSRCYWWSLPGFYKAPMMKQTVQNLRRTRELANYHSSSGKPLLSSPTHGTRKSHRLPHSVDRLDRRFVADVKSLFFTVDPVMARKVWNALCKQAS